MGVQPHQPQQQPAPQHRRAQEQAQQSQDPQRLLKPAGFCQVALQASLQASLQGA
jgi:phosphohistidine phosphatase SixA